MHISNMIADIGDTAAETGEKMHSVQEPLYEWAESYAKIQDKAKEAGISTEKYIDKSNKLLDFADKVSELKELNDVDLKGISFDDKTTAKGEEALKSVVDKAIELGVVSDDSAESVAKVVDMLTEMGLTGTVSVDALSESFSKAQVQGLNFNNPNALETTKVWSFQTIHQILNNEVYIGNLVQNKISTLSYKDKKKIQLSPDKWIRVENAHEPIISKEAFERVKALQKIKTKSINAQDPKYESIFSGLIFCADCKHSMIRKYNRRGQHEFVGYMCSTYKTHGNRVCTSHSIDYEELTDAVLLSIQREARKILSNDDVEELKKTSCRNRRIENIEKEIEFAEERKQKINKFKKKTYQSYLEELISKADYKEYTANYDKELEEIEAEISGLEKRREDDKELESEYQEWVDKFSEYVDIDKLTRGIVIELIERIDVSEDGSICIHYRFKNPYED